MNSILLAACMPVVMPMTDGVNSRVRSLTGLAGLYIIIEDLDADATAIGITVDQLRTATELHFRRHGGIRVMDRDAWVDAPAHPYVVVKVNAIRPRIDNGTVDAFFASMDVDVRQHALLTSELRVTVSTWQTGCVYLCPQDQAKAETLDALARHLD